MSHDLIALEAWASTLLARLSPSARRKLTQQLAQDLRRSQQQRIQAQQDPDGTPYTPRKQRKSFKDKQGRIKKQKAAMFTKLRTNTHLKAKADENQIEVGFEGRVARIARVHQYGLRDRVSSKQALIQYDERTLLGLGDKELNAARLTIIANTLR